MIDQDQPAVDNSNRAMTHPRAEILDSPQHTP